MRSDSGSWVEGPMAEFRWTAGPPETQRRIWYPDHEEGSACRGGPAPGRKTKDLIYNVGRLIEFASSFYTLYPGDVYYTGTPQGVSPVKPGDVLRGKCDQVGEFEIKVRAHQA